MFRNHLLIAWRCLLKKKLQTAINIAGLAIGIATCLFYLEKWLADFAYRVELQWRVFALAGFAAIGVAFLTVGFQSVKAALANPAESLRSE